MLSLPSHLPLQVLPLKLVLLAGTPFHPHRQRCLHIHAWHWHLVQSSVVEIVHPAVNLLLTAKAAAANMHAYFLMPTASFLKT